MTKLSASILSADFACLGDECCEVLDAGADMIHFDVMDGHFVDNLSFGLPVLEGLHRMLPQVYMDVHLMISHPLVYAPRFAAAGASCITFHVEAEDDISAVIDAIHASGCQAGLAVDPETPAETMLPYLDRLSLLLVMGVTPGFGGQSFQTCALDKLRLLRKTCSSRGLSPFLSVDGGVKAEGTGPACVQAGADLLVAGSAVFGAADRFEAVRRFRAL